MVSCTEYDFRIVNIHFIAQAFAGKDRNIDKGSPDGVHDFRCAKWVMNMTGDENRFGMFSQDGFHGFILIAESVVVHRTGVGIVECLMDHDESGAGKRLVFAQFFIEPVELFLREPRHILRRVFRVENNEVIAVDPLIVVELVVIFAHISGVVFQIAGGNDREMGVYAAWTVFPL